MKKLALLSAMFIAGCFDTSVTNGLQLKCDTERRDCQPGFFCFIPAGTKYGDCVNVVQLTDPQFDFSGGTTVINDFSTPPTDMTTVDLKTPPDLFMYPSTCAAGGGTSLGDGSFACKGTWNFNTSNASTLCTNKVCATISPAAKSVCDTLSGFYFGNIGGSVDYATGSVFECGVRTSGAPVFYGCGKGGLVSAPCNGFNGYLKCDPLSNFTCTVDISSINYSIGTGPNMGVVCCP